MRHLKRHPLLALAATCLLAATFADAADPQSDAAFKPFVQTVPKTTVKFDMIPVKGGTVEMELPDKDGKPAKQKVTVKDLYWGKFEVTWDNFTPWRLLKDRPDLSPTEKHNYEAYARPSPVYGVLDHGWGIETFPVLHITYHSATEYCKWLSAATGRKYRLPTEAEWQYACMAGGTGPKDEAAVKAVAWCKENAEVRDGDKADDIDLHTHQCGTKAPNAFGLYDMLGNAAEWCVPADGEKWAVPQGKDGKTGVKYMTGVLKGGSFMSEAADISCTARAPYDKAWQQSDDMEPNSHWVLYDAPFAGFRVVCEP